MNERRVRVSAKAVVIRGGKLLAVRMRDSDGTFYILPGGGQQAGELLPEAVRREVAEETGILVRPADTVFVIEGMEGEPHHRVDIVMRCEYEGETAAAEREPDRNQVGFDWLPVDTLNRLPLYPSRLRRAIMNLSAGKPQPVYLGNENMGDPEQVE